ncbi:MAG: hypothetical protein ACQEVT_04020 [Pseudomonadota bacterium]|uniref:hypothetical protein n=1 Tax=Roseovarius TaxID=74030 RepID=UPI0022A8719E|nr:hypothetical protein [Roseovarius sp. EGI FJ00037]MCZ0812783.1 hypothetical protein [Roseovarius sp. EGI FJ00037]
MKSFKIALILPAIGLLSACAVPEDKSRDRGIDSKHLSQLQAGIWVDPNGCDHWIIDDGLEGYLSARTDRYGKPVCSGVAPPTVATGPFKSGSSLPDPR